MHRLNIPVPSMRAFAVAGACCRWVGRACEQHGESPPRASLRPAALSWALYEHAHEMVVGHTQLPHRNVGAMRGSHTHPLGKPRMRIKDVVLCGMPRHNVAMKGHYTGAHYSLSPLPTDTLRATASPLRVPCITTVRARVRGASTFPTAGYPQRTPCSGLG